MSSWMLFFMVIIAGAYAEDYCNLEICSIYGIPHTMCLYPSPQPSQVCGNWQRMGLSDAEKQEILDMHNEERRKVAAGQETRGNPGPQPAALNMPDLIWDKELEVIAQRWANQCTFDHDKCRHLDKYQVGQNGAAADDANSEVGPFVQGWIDEVGSMSSNDVKSFRGNDPPYIGHYTQVVHDKTTMIGCGRIFHEIPGSKTRHLLICNYAPSGNFPGQPIYETKE